MSTYCHYCGEGIAVGPTCERCSPRLKADREAIWLKLCPPAFLTTDPARLPRQAAARRALAHDFAQKGLVMHGPSGSGKTRVAWLLLKNQVLAGKRVRVLSTLSALDYAAQFANSSENVRQWVASLVSCDLLMLDDVFKNKLTDSFEGMVFAVIDQRSAHNRKILVTSNDTGETLAGRLSADRGVPLVRRLREFCDSINFK